MIRNKALILAGLILLLGLVLPYQQTEAKGSPTYTITPNSSTYKGAFTNYTTLNSKTKHYYLIRSYLERLEKTGGGTLVLKKGTYNITNALYVPSNVTIKMKNGVKINKATKTGTSKFDAAKTIFQFIRPSLAGKSNVYGGYKGEKNISIIGEGKVTIDLKYDHESIAFIIGHNQNILIDNINFKNMHSGHFIEIDATKNAVIKNNSFTNSKASGNRNKEAINIDTPDKTTLGWSLKWSKFDKTPNKHMVISNNKFYNLDRAVGTHKYSGNKFHDEVIIKDNTIKKTRQDAIRVMNWSNSTIENNLFKKVGPGSKGNRRGILASGALNPTFKNNTFVDMPRPMQFMAWKNSGHGSQYDITYNKISNKNKKALETNTVIENEEDFIRINKKYNKFDKANTDIVPVKTGVFYDFNESNSGYDEALNLVDQGIINGYDDYSFKPYRAISREHAALLLFKALDLKVPSNTNAVLKQYKDVDSNYRYAKEIAAVTKADIFGGSSGKFNPQNKITRSQMATVLVKAFNLKETDASINLDDIDKIGSSHRDNVKILAQNKITTGKPNGKGGYYFDGNGDLFRSQFAIFLDKAMQINN